MHTRIKLLNDKGLHLLADKIKHTGRRLQYRAELFKLTNETIDQLTRVLQEFKAVESKCVKHNNADCYTEPDVELLPALTTSSIPEGLVLDVLLFAKLKDELGFIYNSLKVIVK